MAEDYEPRQDDPGGDYEHDAADEEGVPAPEVAAAGQDPADASGLADDEDTEAVEGGDVDDGSLQTRLAARMSDARVANRDNAGRLGELTIWYESRTVVLPIDGDSALRVLAAWQRDELWRGDFLEPATSSAANLWAVVELGVAPLAMVWTPAEALGRRRADRIAVDPAVA